MREGFRGVAVSELKVEEGLEEEEEGLAFESDDDDDDEVDVGVPFGETRGVSFEFFFSTERLEFEGTASFSSFEVDSKTEVGRVEGEGEAIREAGGESLSVMGGVRNEVGSALGELGRESPSFIFNVDSCVVVVVVVGERSFEEEGGKESARGG